MVALPVSHVGISTGCLKNAGASGQIYMYILSQSIGDQLYQSGVNK